MKQGSYLPLAVLFLLFGWVVSFSGCSKKTGTPLQDPAKRYNIMLIVSDALRQDILGCYGGEAETPHIDALARSGVLFENAYSTSPWTTPSAVGMFTGNYASTYGHTPSADASGRTPLQVFVPHSEFLFAEALERLDYINIMAIENVNASIHNNLQGFNPLRDEQTFKKAVPPQMYERLVRITDGESYESKAFENAFVVLKHLLAIPPGESFFFLHWMLDPHYPYEPIEKFASKIDVDESKLPHEKKHYTNSIIGEVTLSAVEQRYVKDLYRAEVESVDERVGYIMKVLEHNNLLDNTYIVFASDHGEQFGDHGLYGHGGFGRTCHYYEGLVRVPLIIAGPGLQGDIRVAPNVSLLGLMPTLRELLGVDYECDVQGESLLPLVRGSEPAAEVLYFDDVQEHEQVDALLEGSYKLISLRDGSFELYDVAADVGEETNLAGTREQIRISLFERIVQIRKTNDEIRRNHVSAIGDSLEHLSDQERRAIMRQLRVLGYVE